MEGVELLLDGMENVAEGMGIGVALGEHLGLGYLVGVGFQGVKHVDARVGNTI